MNSNLSCGEFPGVRAEIHAGILVIDDEPLVRWSIVAGLRHAGFAAVGAGSPEEATRLAAQTRPVLALFDVRLWGTDPVRLLQEIRTLAPNCRILILAVEGQDLAVPTWNGIDVIRKPFDLHAVVERAETVLSRPAHGVRMAV
jgi:DNA-binding response OmpR family regulator